ncbi:MAG: CIA30 family protein [Gemmataceae bacterium]
MQWYVVNDGVMGGVSRGEIRLTPDGSLFFSGELSLAFQGGFASFRSRPTPLHLQPGDALCFFVRGDGRTYSVNLYPERGPMAFSFRASLPTVDGHSCKMVLPLTDFRATQFGREVSGVALEPSRIVALGVMLADKQPGPFMLEVQRIEVLKMGDPPRSN